MNKKKINRLFVIMKIVLYEYMISDDINRTKILKTVEKAINILTVEIYKL